MRARVRVAWLGGALAAVAALGGGFALGRLARAPNAGPRPIAFAPPPGEPATDTPFGREAALGRAIFLDPARFAPRYVGNDLKCSNCHLDEGRLAHSAPLWGAYTVYPQYRAKNGHVNTFAERLQGCFKYSENGKAPPLGDEVLVALESYAFYLTRGAPTGVRLPGAGYPKLARPPLAPDYVRGQDVYTAKCAVCHGFDGGGRSARGQQVMPPLWGDRSFNWGAGMADIRNAAAFIKANMPLGEGGSLNDQQAFDAAAFVDGHPRPQDPRFTGDLGDTRRRFHDSTDSLYGETVNGVLLGAGSRPTSHVQR